MSKTHCCVCLQPVRHCERFTCPGGPITPPEEFPVGRSRLLSEVYARACVEIEKIFGESVDSARTARVTWRKL